MKKLTIEGEELKEEFKSTYADEGCRCHTNPPCSYCLHPGNPNNLVESPMLWNSVSAIKAGSKWFASYDMLKCDATVVIGSGATEQEAIDNLPARELL